MKVKSIAECSKGSILQYFRPSLSYHLSLRSLFCLLLSGRCTQVYCSSPFLSVLSHLSQLVDSIHDNISVFHEQGVVGMCHFPLESYLIMLFLRVSRLPIKPIMSVRDMFMARFRFVWTDGLRDVRKMAFRWRVDDGPTLNAGLKAL